MKITVKQVQEARKYALHCYRQFSKASDDNAPDTTELFDMYVEAFDEYRKLDTRLFEQQMEK